MIDKEFPVRLDSASNSRHDHWAQRHKLAAEQRLVGCNAGAGLARVLAAQGPVLPCRVVLTRIAPRALDDDNLRGAFKAVRDGVADALGIRDNDPRVKFEYEQERGAPKEYGFRVGIERAS